MNDATATITKSDKARPVDTGFAWISLTRLGGCNYRVPVVRRTAKSVFVCKPHEGGTIYRIPAAAFDAGEFAIRDSWAIRRWDEKAQRTQDSERNWQT